jgi:hypothetical protein
MKLSLYILPVLAVEISLAQVALEEASPWRIRSVC